MPDHAALLMLTPVPFVAHLKAARSGSNVVLRDPHIDLAGF